MELNTNKSSFKYLVLFLYLVLILPPGFSETNSTTIEQKGFFSDINYSLGTGLSYLNGQYREIVYPSTGWESPYYSELLWNLDNLFLLNIYLGASKGSWSLDLSLGTSITKGTGEMEDYDWGDSTIDNWTNWSESLIFVDKSFFLDISSSFKYKLNNSFTVPIKLGYRLNYLDWEDESGEYIYYWDFIAQDYYSSVQTGDFGGVNGIDYMVIQNIFYASSGIYYTLNKITAGVNLAISPFINAWDLDHHIYRGLYFMDSFTSNFWYRTEFVLKLKAGIKGEFLVTLFREELPETTGNTYKYNEDPSDSEEVGTQTGYYPNGAGMASILWGIGLSYIWSF